MWINIEKKENVFGKNDYNVYFFKVVGKCDIRLIVERPVLVRCNTYCWANLYYYVWCAIFTSQTQSNNYRPYFVQLLQKQVDISRFGCCLIWKLLKANVSMWICMLCDVTKNNWIQVWLRCSNIEKVNARVWFPQRILLIIFCMIWLLGKEKWSSFRKRILLVLYKADELILWNG